MVGEDTLAKSAFMNLASPYVLPSLRYRWYLFEPAAP
jgi:hypothetical protein